MAISATSSIMICVSSVSATLTLYPFSCRTFVVVGWPCNFMTSVYGLPEVFLVRYIGRSWEDFCTVSECALLGHIVYKPPSLSFLVLCIPIVHDRTQNIRSSAFLQIVVLLCSLFIQSLYVLSSSILLLLYLVVTKNPFFDL